MVCCWFVGVFFFLALVVIKGKASKRNTSFYPMVKYLGSKTLPFLRVNIVHRQQSLETVLFLKQPKEGCFCFAALKTRFKRKMLKCDGSKKLPPN